MRIRYGDVYERKSWERVVYRDTAQGNLFIANIIPQDQTYLHWAVEKRPSVRAFMYASTNKELPPKALVPVNAVLNTRAYSRGQIGRTYIPRYVSVPLALDVSTTVYITKTTEVEGYTKYTVTTEKPTPKKIGESDDSELIG